MPKYSTKLQKKRTSQRAPSLFYMGVQDNTPIHNQATLFIMS